MFRAVAIFLLKVEHERIELLEHPLITELLNHKWNKIAMPSIILQLIFYLTFLGFVTAYVLSLPNPRGDICARSKNGKLHSCIVKVYIVSNTFTVYNITKHSHV